MFIISKHSALSSTRQDVFLILTASAAVPPRTQSAAQLPSLAPHDSKARLRAVTSSRDSWRSHVHRAHTAQRVQLFKHQTGNVGGRRGRSLPFSGGFKGGILFEKRIPPLVPRRARRSPFAPVRKSGPFSLSRGSPPLPRAAPSALPSPRTFVQKIKKRRHSSRRFSICITAKPFCCRGWPSCAALC